jgi:hypothetical protein
VAIRCSGQWSTRLTAPIELNKSVFVVISDRYPVKSLQIDESADGINVVRDHAAKSLGMLVGREILEIY